MLPLPQEFIQSRNAAAENPDAPQAPLSPECGQAADAMLTKVQADEEAGVSEQDASAAAAAKAKDKG
jgi:hypothetical protein